MTTPDTHFSAYYDKTVRHINGQVMSRVMQAVTVIPHTEGLDYYSDAYEYEDRIAQDVNTRYADSPHADIAYTRRRIRLKMINDGKLIDHQDIKNFSPHDPEDATVKAITAGINRKIDQTIIDAIFGTAYGGQDGATSYAFTGGNVVAVNSWAFDDSGSSGNTGLTVSKLIEARNALLLANDLDDNELSMDSINILVTQRQLSDLLKFTKVTSADFAQVKALVNGEIGQLMGINFIRVSPSRLPLISTTHRRCPMFFKSAIRMIDGQQEHWVRPRADKQGMPYAYSHRFIGAGRMQEKKVWDIRCIEA